MCHMLQVLSDGTYGGLHQQLSHPPKQCRDGGSLHVQPKRTYKDHHLSVFFNPELQRRTYHKSSMEPYKPRLFLHSWGTGSFVCTSTCDSVL